MAYNFIDRAFEERDEVLASYRAAASTSITSGRMSQLLASGANFTSPFLQAEDLQRAADQYQRYKGWVYVAVSRIATRVAGQKVMIGRKEKPVKKRGTSTKRYLKSFERERAPMYVKSLDSDIEVLETHELLDAIANPNDVMVPWTMLYTTVASLELTGRSYWWMPVDKKGVMQIWPLPSSWVQPIHTEQQLYSAYRIMPPNVSGTGWIVDAADIAMFQLPNPGDPLETVSPVQTQSAAIAADEAIQAAQWRAFKNGIFPKMALVVGRNPGLMPGEEGEVPILEDDNRADIIEAVRAVYEGVVNYDEPLILDGMIADVKKITNTVQEMDFLQSGNITKSRIFQALGVNPIIAGEITGVNRAQAATADEIFCANCVNPLAVLIGQVITKRYQDQGLVVWIEMAKPADPEQRLREWQSSIQAKAVTKNEYRANVLNLPPLEEGGDEIVGDQPQQQDPFGMGGGIPGQFGQPAQEEPNGGGNNPKKPGEEKPKEEEEEVVYDWDESQKFVPIMRCKALRKLALNLFTKQADRSEDSIRSAMVKFLGNQDEAILRELRREVNDNPLDFEKGGAAETIAKRCFRPEEWDVRSALAKPIAETVLTGYLSAKHLHEKRRQKAFAKWVKTEHVKAKRNRRQPDDEIIPPELAAEREWLEDWKVDPEVQKAILTQVKASMQGPWWDDLSNNRLKKLEKAIADNLDQGVEPMIEAVAKALGKDTIHHADITARTEVTGALNAGHVLQGEQLERQGMKVLKYWGTSEDPFVRESHVAASQPPTSPVEGTMTPFVLAGGYQCLFPGEETLPPEERCNCLLPGTLVEGSFIAGAKSFYRGRVTKFVTRAGRRFTITPNHPVLTSRGFIPAGELKNGEKILSYSPEIDPFVVRSTGGDHEHNGPSPIEKVFESLRLIGVSRGLPVEFKRAAINDLHGDGRSVQGDIEIVGAFGELLRDVVSSGDYHRGDFVFSPEYGAEAFESGECDLCQMVGSHFASTVLRGEAGYSLGEQGRVRLSHGIPRSPRGLSFGSYLDVQLPEAAREDRSVAADFVSDLHKRFPGQVSLDEVVEVWNGDSFVGHVYDLQSVSGLIVSNGLAFSNCRCAVICDISDEGWEGELLDFENSEMADVAGWPSDLVGEREVGNMQTKSGVWEEEEHPRDESGKFAPKGSSDQTGGGEKEKPAQDEGGDVDQYEDDDESKGWFGAMAIEDRRVARSDPDLTTRLTSVPGLVGAKLDAYENGTLIHSSVGKDVSVRFEEPGELDELAKTLPAEYGESVEASGSGGKKVVTGVYRNGQIILRSDATADEISHELVHALDDLGLVSGTDIAMFGGHEEFAYAYQDWVKRGANVKESGLFARVRDFFLALVGNKDAQERRAMRAVDNKMLTSLGVDASKVTPSYKSLGKLDPKSPESAMAQDGGLNVGRLWFAVRRQTDKESRTFEDWNNAFMKSAKMQDVYGDPRGATLRGGSDKIQADGVEDWKVGDEVRFRTSGKMPVKKDTAYYITANGKDGISVSDAKGGKNIQFGNGDKQATMINVRRMAGIANQLATTAQIYERAGWAGMPDVEGGDNPFRENSDPLFAFTFDLTTVCPNQDMYVDTIRELQKRNNRLYDARERAAIGAMLEEWGGASKSACWYCYGQAARDAVVPLVRKMSAIWNAGLKRDPKEIDSIRKEYFDTRYAQVALAAKKGKIPDAEFKKQDKELGKKVKDLNKRITEIWGTFEHSKKWDPGKYKGRETKQREASAITQLITDRDWRGSKEMNALMNDKPRMHDIAMGYVEPQNDAERKLLEVARTYMGPMQINIPKGWGSYWRQALTLGKDGQGLAALTTANRAAGIRVNSQSDYRPWHSIDTAQMMTHLKTRKDADGNPIAVHAYTRSPEYVEIFGKTGMYFNLSVEYAKSPEGGLFKGADGRPDFGAQGVSLKDAMRLRGENPDHVGTMLVALNLEDVRTALDDDRIDMMIPFHKAKVPTAVAEWREAVDMAKDQHEHWPGLKGGSDEEGDGEKGGKYAYANKTKKDGVVQAKVKVELSNGKTVELRVGQQITREHHFGSRELYLELCKSLEITPRYSSLTWMRKKADGTTEEVSVTEHPGYMKMIRDVSSDKDRGPKFTGKPLDGIDPEKIDWKRNSEVIENDIKHRAAIEELYKPTESNKGNPEVLEWIEKRISSGNWAKPPHQLAAGQLPILNVANEPSDMEMLQGQVIPEEGEPEPQAISTEKPKKPRKPKLVHRGYTNVPADEALWWKEGASVKFFVEQESTDDLADVVSKMPVANDGAVNVCLSVEDDGQPTGNGWKIAAAQLIGDILFVEAKRGTPVD